ncbi:Crp/Fnr family transcriptional regulator [Desulfofalx alkaliphila]|uniref:Crp/Fnr family transcriptional regulator n=1 Tax=Desulfofalx alkaliphila TaxID=105483 RepID=UPI0004E140D0|nr:Crp/Fnr family transcriptional regulator [Desulfofalx alkaliphila]
MKETIQYLKKCSLFAQLNDAQLAEMAKLVKDKKYDKGQFIFFEEEPGEALFILKSGLIKLTKQTEDGREHILHFVHPGEVFAEVVIFDGGDYPATAEVQQPSIVGSILNKDMEQLVQNNPSIALSMLRIMSRRLRIAQYKAMNLALNDVRRRLIFMLLELATEHGVQRKEGLVLSLPLTNQELANMVGTSRESVNRIINDLRKTMALEVTRQEIIIKDRKKLRSLL